MIAFDEKVMIMAKDLLSLYKDIDYYDVVDATHDIDNIEGEFVDHAYKQLLDPDSRLDITMQLEELKLDIDDPITKINIDNMINRIETLFQPKLAHINNKYENLKDMHMYNDQQLHEIEKGIMSDIDIRYYLGEHFDANQMYQIRSLMEYKKNTGIKDIEVSIIANKHFSYGQMGEIKRCYQAGLSTEQILHIANPDLSRMQMSQLREMYLDGASIEEVKNVAFPLYKFEHLWTIREIYRSVSDKSMLPAEIYDWNMNFSDLQNIKLDILQNIGEKPQVRSKGIMAALEEIRKSRSKVEKETNQNQDRSY